MNVDVTEYRHCILLDASEECSAGSEEPDRFMHTIKGTVGVLSGDSIAPTKIGSFEAIYADCFGADTASVSLFDVFNAYSEEMHECHQALLSENGCFKPAVRKAAEMDADRNANLLLITRLVIFPEHRGHGAGLAALRGLMHMLQRGAGIVAMKPFPLQFEYDLSRVEGEERELQLGAFKGTLTTGRSKLRKYYARLGFKRVGKSEFMVRGCDTPLPDVDSLFA